MDQSKEQLMSMLTKYFQSKFGGKCPYCAEEGRTSTVGDNGHSTTLLGFTPGYWDEQGIYHKTKDPNRKRQYFHCSNDHRWMITGREGEEPIIVKDFGHD